MAGRKLVGGKLVGASYILHLDRAVARSAQVAWLVENLPGRPEVFSATDAAAIPAAERARYVRQLYRPGYPFALRDGEIACFLSYRRLWDRIAGGNDPALIVEDDVAFDPGRFHRAVAMALRHIGDAGYVRFDRARPKYPGGRLIEAGDGMELVRPDRTGLGMIAQMVSPGMAARLLLATGTFDRPVDTFLQLDWISGCELLCLSDSSIREVSAGLGGSTIAIRRSLGGKLAREILRPVYRARVALARRGARGRPGSAGV